MSKGGGGVAVVYPVWSKMRGVKPCTRTLKKKVFFYSPFFVPFLLIVSSRTFSFFPY